MGQRTRDAGVVAFQSDVCQQRSRVRWGANRSEPTVGKDPIYRRPREDKALGMRKSGNGHQVDVEQFINDLKSVVQEGQELLKSGLSGVKEQTLGGVETATEFARENPFKAVGLGFAVGLLAGLGAALLFFRGED